MKVTICASGTLKLKSENELESYALRKWGEEHFAIQDEQKRMERILIDTSFPVVLGKRD